MLLYSTILLCKFFFRDFGVFGGGEVGGGVGVWNRLVVLPFISMEKDDML